ncbi:MAG TPA: CARDB domain-containing protein [Methanomassiliicoccales archaeon]|nr:CARDB domain-containing protein [Methanomassiliicoccales archaeon]
MIILVACLFIGAMPLVQADTATSPLYAHLDGPMTVTVGANAHYVLTMVGGPAEAGDGNYSWKAELNGENTYNSFLLPNSGGPITSGVVSINLTAPEVPQTLTITINCTSANTVETVTTSIEYKVLVVEPVVLSATIRNTGNVSVTDVPLVLQIYQDGGWVQFYNTSLSLEAGGSYAFLYNWTALDLKSGEHKVRMLLDPNNQIVTFEGGSAVYETTIYYKMSGYGGVNSLLWVLVILLGFVTFMVWRRPNPKTKRRR